MECCATREVINWMRWVGWFPKMAKWRLAWRLGEAFAS